MAVQNAIINPVYRKARPKRGSDGHRPYLEGVEEAIGGDSDHRVDHQSNGHGARANDRQSKKGDDTQMPCQSA
jgi:hypothetical protein